METRAQPITICIPVYNDWSSLERLLGELDGHLSDLPESIRVLVVDDGSGQPPPADLIWCPATSLDHVRIVRLRRNVGHQKAIAVGLCLLWSEGQPCSVLVMDGDGQDAPADALRLIERYRALDGRVAVFAARARRSESLTFRLGYQLYRLVHKALTGTPVRLGNFSVLPWEHLETLVVAPELWSHYAAAVMKYRLPMATVWADRRERYTGQSKMNFVSLVVHGLTAISVFADIVGVRLLLGTLALMVLSSVTLVAVIFVRLFTDLAIAGWATTAAGLLVVLNFQLLLMAFTVAFIILVGSKVPNAPPESEFRVFLSEHGDP